MSLYITEANISNKTSSLVKWSVEQNGIPIVDIRQINNKEFKIDFTSDMRNTDITKVDSIYRVYGNYEIKENTDLLKYIRFYNIYV